MTPTRGDRRRRVLTEELLSVGSTTPARGGANAANRRDPAVGPQADRRYTPAVAYDQQSRVTDIVPRWLVTIALLWLTGVALTAGLVVLHLRRSDVAVLLGQTRLPVFDLAGLRGGACGSLAVWFAAALLGTAMVMALLIYSVRQHRIDDYHGRYRVWLWAALVWLTLSINSMTQLHRVLADALTYWTGWSLLAGGAVWWLIPAALLAVTVGVRLLAETLECGIALVVLTMAYGCWSAAILVHLGVLVVGDPAQTTLVIGSAVLGGHVSLLTAQVLYARHVVLDAEGLRPIRQRPPRPTGQAAARPSVRPCDVQTVSSQSATAAGSAKPQGERGPSKQSGTRPAAAPASRSSGKTASRRRVAEVDGHQPQTADFGPETASKHAMAERRSSAAVSGGQHRSTGVAQWTDGRDAVDDDSHDDASQAGKRRLSKAERKRLRKLKQKARQRHAA